MKHETRNKLIGAALEIMAEKGYRGATTREIASRAGVCELTLFRHFGTKENLFREVLNEYSFVPALKEIIHQGRDASPVEVLKRIGIEFYRTMRKKRPIMRVVLSEVALRPEPVSSLLKDIIFQCITELKHYFSGLRKAGIIRNINEESAARTFFGSIFAFFHTEEIILGKTPRHKTIEEFIDTLTDIILKGVLNEKLTRTKQCKK